MNFESSDVAASLAGKYLTVVLETETYGLNVLKIREIIRLQNITPVPELPECLKGVINRRGRVISVVDLRVKFGLKAEFHDRSCIVVVQVNPSPTRLVQIGLIVDRVEEIVSFSAADIEPTPAFGTSVDTAYLLGMARMKEQTKMIFNIDRVVALEALPAIQRKLPTAKS